MSSTRTPKIVAFVDTETTGLDPFLHDPWEIAVILRVDGQDEEHVLRIRPDISNADPAALDINRYFERVSAADWVWDDREAAARRLHALLDGAVIVGSNPAFDAEMITHLLGRYFDQPRPWHYRTIDVVTLAAGSLYGRAAERARRGVAAWFPRIATALGWPWRSYDTSRLVGIDPPTPEAGHTALPDARWVRDLWDQITVPTAPFAASDEQLAAMVGDPLPHLGWGQR
ncbi:3'-5' exonuclease [Streptomyces collinus]